MNNALLVPTDFSQNSLVALEYAMRLAEKFNWSVHTFHTFTPIRNALAGLDFVNEVQAASLGRKQEDMDAVLEKMEGEFSSVQLTGACIEGDLTQVTLKLIEEGAYRLVIMGTKGAGKIKGATIGSNTFDLIQNSPIGVLAVPEDKQTFGLKKLGLLTNFKETELALFRGFINRINTPMSLSLLHAFEAKDAPAPEDVQYWQSKFDNPLLIDVSYTQEEIVHRLDYNSPIPRCIERMIEREQVDVLLVSYNRKSFFRQLFSKSLSRKIALNPTIPTYFIRDN